MFRVPLAWNNLTHDRRKFAVAVSGIAFAVILMFQQRGFNNALFDSAVVLVEQVAADVLIFHETRFSLAAETRFDRDVLDIAAATPGVRAADAVYMENSAAFLQAPGGKPRPIRVIGLDIFKPLLIDKSGQVEDLTSLASVGTAKIDQWSKREYGFDLQTLDPQVGELAGKPLSIVGNFQLGRDFANDGSLVMSEESIAHFFPYRRWGDPLGVVDMGLVHCDDPGQAKQIAEELRVRLDGRPVKVLTREEMISEEKKFWGKATPIGYIFLVGSIMGFVVGVIICYQILATDINDHLSEFATLKAMGYSNGYFFRLVCTESLLLSLLGFLPGWLISTVLFQLNTAFTGLQMRLDWERSLWILGLTLMMCLISGLLALRKLLTSDPAELF